MDLGLKLKDKSNMILYSSCIYHFLPILVLFVYYHKVTRILSISHLCTIASYSYLWPSLRFEVLNHLQYWWATNERKTDLGAKGTRTSTHRMRIIIRLVEILSLYIVFKLDSSNSSADEIEMSHQNRQIVDFNYVPELTASITDWIWKKAK